MAADGCGAPVQGGSLSDVDTAGKTIIQGVVTVGGEPVGSAYVRLLDGSGEFTAEVVSSSAGEFRFFAAPGSWTVRALSAKGTGEVPVTAEQGVTEAAVVLSGG